MTESTAEHALESSIHFDAAPRWIERQSLSRQIAVDEKPNVGGRSFVLDKVRFLPHYGCSDVIGACKGSFEPEGRRPMATPLRTCTFNIGP